MRRSRSQAAVDFLTSYGFAILIIAITLYAILQLGIFNYSQAPQYCYSNSPFSCVAYSVNTSGVMELVMSQSSGGILNITGVACSSASNTTRVGPEYGNVKVLSYSATPQFYPPDLSVGGTLYPGGSKVLYVKCYRGNLGPATGSLGATFTGYVWINYTFSGLPQSYHNIASAASISVKYT